jgi:hypothetical protein
MSRRARAVNRRVWGLIFPMSGLSLVEPRWKVNKLYSLPTVFSYSPLTLSPSRGEGKRKELLAIAI